MYAEPDVAEEIVNKQRGGRLGKKRRERRRTERAGGAARFRTQVEDRQQGRQRRQAEQRGSYFRKEALGSDQHAYTLLINKLASLFCLLVDRYFLKCFLQCSFRGFCPDTDVSLVNLLTPTGATIATSDPHVGTVAASDSQGSAGRGISATGRPIDAAVALLRALDLMQLLPNMRSLILIHQGDARCC